MLDESQRERLDDYQRGLRNGLHLAANWLEIESSMWIQQTISARFADMAKMMRQAADDGIADALAEKAKSE